MGFTSEGFRCQKVNKMSSKFDATNCMEKSRFREGPIEKRCTRLVARRVVRRKFGRNEERKKGRKK